MRFPIWRFGKKKDEGPASAQKAPGQEDGAEQKPAMNRESAANRETGSASRAESVVNQDTGFYSGERPAAIRENGAAQEQRSVSNRDAGSSVGGEQVSRQEQEHVTSSARSEGGLPSLPVYGDGVHTSEDPNRRVRGRAMFDDSNGRNLGRAPHVLQTVNAAAVETDNEARGQNASVDDARRRRSAPVEAMTPRMDEELSDTLILEESVTVRLDLGNAQAQPQMPVPGRMAAPEVRIGCFSHKGTREYQQDALAFKTEEWRGTSRTRAAAVLCDGMGGLNAGEKASGHASGRLLEELDVPWDEFPEIYPDALSDINYEVAHLKDSSGAFLKTGTTAVSAAIENGGMFYASVGDSRIYLLRDGRLISLTRDHTYGNQLDDLAAAGRISSEEARDAANRAALTSYLGGRRLEQIQYNREELRLVPGDIVLLCSDGLYKSLSTNEITYIMGVCGADAALAARRLVEMAISRPGRHDNTTVLVMTYVAG